MALQLLTPPPVEPVTLAELKEYLRVDPGDTSQDNVILDLAMAARAWAESHTRRCFVASTWRLLVDFFPGYIDLKLAGANVSSPFVSGSNAILVGIRYAAILPYPPVNGIVAFQYQNANGQVTPMVEGVDYIADLISNPARLTPPFGLMWPVARVVVNAINIDFALGYATPLTVSSDDGSPPNFYQITSTGYVFQASDIGRPISIEGGAANGGTLNTVIRTISSPPDVNAVLRDPVLSSVSDAAALLVNAPAGNPRHWYLIKRAISSLVIKWFETRIPDEKTIPQRVKDMLSPVRDLRL